MVWQPATATTAKKNCCGAQALTCAGCCCVEKTAAEPKPLAPLPTRVVSQEPITLILPTVSESLLLDRSSSTASLAEAEFSISTGALPLFRRDCALLI